MNMHPNDFRVGVYLKRQRSASQYTCPTCIRSIAGDSTVFVIPRHTAIHKTANTSAVLANKCKGTATSTR